VRGLCPRGYSLFTDEFKHKSCVNSKTTCFSYARIGEDFCHIWVKVKVNVKLSLCLNKHHATKAYWGSGGIPPRIL
jgi:hypothetical protein